MSGIAMRGLMSVVGLALAAAPMPSAAQLIKIQSIIAISPNEGGSAPPSPFEDNRLSTPVTIAGAGPYNFIVDTGAERSVISTELARELGLDVVGGSSVYSMDGARTAYRVDAEGLAIGGASHDLQVFALSRDHIGAAGVVGMDALRDQRVVFDFVADHITVEPAPARAASERGEITVPTRLRNGQLLLNGAHVGGVPVDVILDTGLEVSLGNEPLRRLVRTREEQTLRLRGASGEEVRATYAMVDEFHLGRVRLGNLPMAFADADIFETLGINRRPALLLGMETLRIFDRVTVDFANDVAAFRLGGPQA